MRTAMLMNPIRPRCHYCHTPPRAALAARQRLLYIPNEFAWPLGNTPSLMHADACATRLARGACDENRDYAALAPVREECRPPARAGLLAVLTADIAGGL